MGGNRREFYARDIAPIKCNVYTRLSDGNSSNCYVIPDEWKDRYIILGAFGGPLWWYLTNDPLAVCDPGAEASEALGILSTDPDCGERIAENSAARVFIPNGVITETVPLPMLYICLYPEGAAAGWFAYVCSEQILDDCPEPE